MAALALSLWRPRPPPHVRWVPRARGAGVTDSYGLGLRFDAGENGKFGEGNDLLFNVVARNAQGGLAGKANHAIFYRNTGTDNQGGEDVGLRLDAPPPRTS